MVSMQTNLQTNASFSMHFRFIRWYRIICVGSLSHPEAIDMKSFFDHWCYRSLALRLHLNFELVCKLSCTNNDGLHSTRINSSSEFLARLVVCAVNLWSGWIVDKFCSDGEQCSHVEHVWSGISGQSSFRRNKRCQQQCPTWSQATVHHCIGYSGQYTSMNCHHVNFWPWLAN